MTRRTALALALLCALCARPATADDEPPPDEPAPGGPAGDEAVAGEAAEPAVRFRLRGGYRIGAGFGEAFPIDADGTELHQAFRLDHRLRLAPQLDVRGEFEAFVSLDLLIGMLGGSLVDAEIVRDERRVWEATGMRNAELREAGIAFHPVGADVVLGLVRDRWGLGAVAGDGGPPGAGFGDEPFGADEFGDQLLRLAVGIRPAPAPGAAGLTDVDLLLDVVARDEAARLVARGDLALGPAVRVRHYTERSDVGAWLTWRMQRAADGSTGEHALADVYLDVETPAAPRGASLRVAVEAAGRVGRTALSNGWTTDDRDVLGGCAVLDLDVDVPAAWLAVGARAGVSSGDADPLDERQTDLAFDRDFNAGSLLFDEVLASVAARTATELRALTGADTDALADEGAIGGAVFAQPWLALRPHSLIELRVGGVVASGTVPLALLRASDGAGGVHGETAFVGPRFLGGELDAAAELDAPLVPARQLRSRFGLRVEYAHLFPGPALTEGWEVPVPGVDRVVVRMGLTF